MMNTNLSCDVIDDLMGLIRQQLIFLRKGQVSDAFDISEQADRLSQELGRAGQEYRERNLTRIIELRALYDELALSLSVQKQDIMGQMKKISNGKKTLSVYRRALAEEAYTR